MGLICSSGGSVAGSAIKILRRQGYGVEAALVTDRRCNAESMAHHFGIPHRRIVFLSRTQFSREAAHWLYDEQGMSWTCLLFLRLVSPELFDRGPCYNLHPSLLPAFTGFGALEKALEARVRFFGATVHRVDRSVDGGPIVGQIVSPMPVGADLATLRRFSFAQKLYLLLVLAERIATGYEESKHVGFVGGRHLANPSLKDSGLEQAFLKHMNEEGIYWSA